MAKTYFIAGAASAVGLAVGAVSGFLVAKRILEPKYMLIAEEEIADAKEYYSRLYKKDAFANPVDLVDVGTAEKLIERLEYKAVRVEKEVTTQDVDHTDEEEALQFFKEISHAQKHGLPYVIGRDEYMKNETEYTQISLTYFENDDILVDSDDSVLEYVDLVLGENTLAHFGKLSGDNNVVYVRNEAQEIDFEIVRNKGNYAKEVLGFIEHAEHNRVRKFRRDYE